MKKTLIFSTIILTLFTAFAFTYQQNNNKPNYFAGDLLFISNPGGPASTLQLLTKSDYSHIGLILPEKGKLVVYFAGEKVKKCSIQEFTALSKTGKFEHLRLRDTTVLRFTGVPRLVEEANKLMGMPYDKYLSWTDMEMYPSEFVWKVFKRAFDVQLGKTKSLSSFDLTSPVLQKNLKEKYGDNLPFDQKIMSPADLHNSEWLVKVE